jgi:hypothetical protein
MIPTNSFIKRINVAYLDLDLTRMLQGVQYVTSEREDVSSLVKKEAHCVAIIVAPPPLVPKRMDRQRWRGQWNLSFGRKDAHDRMRVGEHSTRFLRKYGKGVSILPESANVCRWAGSEIVPISSHCR